MKQSSSTSYLLIIHRGCCAHSHLDMFVYYRSSCLCHPQARKVNNSHPSPRQISLCSLNHLHTSCRKITKSKTNQNKIKNKKIRKTKTKVNDLIPIVMRYIKIIIFFKYKYFLF